MDNKNNPNRFNGLPAYRQLRFGHIFSIAFPSFFKRSDEKRRRVPRWRLPMHTSFLKIYWPLIQLS
jgi:hypothetical protein